MLPVLGERRRWGWRALAWLGAAAAAGVMVGAAVRLSGVSHRWDWWYTSPNDLGPIAAGVGACACVWGLGIWKGGWRSRVLAVALLLLALVALAAVTGSRSRSAMIGVMAAGMTMISLGRGPVRWGGLAWMVAAGVAILIDPVAAKRAATFTVSGMQQDLSLQHRIDIWQSSLRMLHDLPHGIGDEGPFGYTYMAWYDTSGRSFHIWQPLNDALALMSYWGWGAGVAFAAAMAGSCGAAVAAGWSQRRPLLIGAAVALGCVALGGLTTTLFRGDGPVWTVLGIWFCAVATVVVWGRGRATVVGAGAGAVLGLVLCGVAALYAHHLAAGQAWRADPMATTTAVLPRLEPARGRLVVIAGEAGDVQDTCRKVARPLAGGGYAVAVVPPGGASQEQAAAAWIYLRGSPLEPGPPTGTRAILVDPPGALPAWTATTRTCVLCPRSVATALPQDPPTLTRLPVDAVRVWARHLPAVLPAVLTWLEAP